MRHKSTVYPTLPLDSERIRHYRQRCQKPREMEEIWSWFVLRRISVYITLALRRTTITPNGVSWCSILFMLLAGWFLVFAEPWSYLMAVISYNIGYMCDCIDGELARLTRVTSRRGVFLDTLIRATSIPIVMAIGMALFAGRFVAPFELSLMYGIIVLATMALLVPLSYHLMSIEAEEHDPVSDMRIQSRWGEWLAFFLGLPGFFAILLIGIAIEGLFGVPIYTIFFALFLGLFGIKTLARLYITYNRINEW